MLKRILSVLVIVGILTSFGSVAYGDTKLTDTIDKQYNTLVALGILQMEKETNYEPLNYDTLRDLSKSGFVNFVCNIIGDYKFTERYNEEAIRVAEDSGLIHKNQTDLYKMINYEEALTILVRMMGYETHAQIGGGFPYGYISIARSIGLTDGITAAVGEPLKSYEVITLLYNAINCSYVEILKFTDDGIIYGQGSEKTVLHEMRGLYRIDGVLEATAERFLRPDETVSQGYVRIDGYVYAIEEDVTEYVGMDVTAYVKAEKNSTADTVQILFEDDNNETVIASEQISKIEDNFSKLEYFDADERLRTVRIGQNAPVLYNGQPLATYTNDAFQPADGYIRLINNDGDTEYDAVFITSYEGYIVDSISKTNKVIANAYTYDKDLESLSFNVEIEEEEIIKIFDAFGERIEFTELAEGDVIRAAKSTIGGRTVLNAYVSKEKVDGMVSHLRHENGITYVTVDGVVYETSAAYAKAVAAGDKRAVALKTGAAYTFYLDDAGRIAYVKSLAGVINYAVAFATASDGIFGTNCYIKLFTTHGEWLELTLADKVEFEGTRCEPEDVISEIATAKRDKVLNVIGYKINSDGKIVSVDLPEDYTDDGNDGRLNKKSVIKTTYRGGVRSFNSEIYLAVNVNVVFVDPEKLDKEEAYLLGSRDEILNLQPYTAHAFMIDEGKFAGLYKLCVEKCCTANGRLCQICA